MDIGNIIHQVSQINNQLYELKRRLYYIVNPCIHDWQIDYTIQDILEKKDKEMEKVYEILK